MGNDEQGAHGLGSLGMTQDEWKEFIRPKDGVEIIELDDGNLLVVDGVNVWEDGSSEPEDICLSRDLQDFVRTIKKLAAERTALRSEVDSLNGINCLENSSFENENKKLKEEILLLRLRIKRLRDGIAILVKEVARPI